MQPQKKPEIADKNEVILRSKKKKLLNSARKWLAWFSIIWFFIKSFSGPKGIL